MSMQMIICSLALSYHEQLLPDCRNQGHHCLPQKRLMRVCLWILVEFDDRLMNFFVQLLTWPKIEPRSLTLRLWKMWIITLKCHLCLCSIRVKASWVMSLTESDQIQLIHQKSMTKGITVIPQKRLEYKVCCSLWPTLWFSVSCLAIIFFNCLYYF